MALYCGKFEYMFERLTYNQRRDRLKEEVGSGLIVLLGNEESSMNFKDNWYHFRQDSSFLYFCAVSLPGLAAILDCDSGEEIIFGDELTIDDIIWTGSQPTIAELAEKSGISRTAPASKIESYIQKGLIEGRLIHVLPPYRDETLHEDCRMDKMDFSFCTGKCLREPD